MRQFVLLDELQHLQPRYLSAIEARHHCGKKLWRLGRKRGASGFHAGTQSLGNGSGIGIRRKTEPVLFDLIAKFWRLEIIDAGKQHAGQAMAGFENMARKAAICHAIGRCAEIQAGRGKFFHRQSRIVADRFPRIEYRFNSYHSPIVHMESASAI